MKLRLPWMSRTDRTRWQAARTLEDLGRLTAAWWEGTVDSLPGYPPRRGPAAETLPHVAVLAAANRGGFLTIAAQPGGTDTSHRGVETRQRAAVQGFASDPALICRLVDAAEKAGLEMVLNDMLDANFGPGDGITVTTVDGTPDTVFGYALGIRSLVAMWRGCPGAIGPLGKALQITLADRQFGPSTLLWDTLAATVGPPAPSPAPKIMCRKCGCTYRQICADGCTGVQDQADGRCEACIDPSIVIDWSTEPDDSPKECALCGAPFYGARRHCTVACLLADASDGGGGEQSATAAARPADRESDDPWS
ncbi:hypothetical protein OG612_45200 (plasmid) [Streptomyces sp. NBC_01527]|uniref:DUF6919 domain-containing protein n=1 Tax=Streptomyces sp. NBC_01527 TaxID=2903894 RepID=UPI002F90BFB9